MYIINAIYCMFVRRDHLLGNTCTREIVRPEVLKKHFVLDKNNKKQL